MNPASNAFFFQVNSNSKVRLWRDGAINASFSVAGMQCQIGAVINSFRVNFQGPPFHSANLPFLRLLRLIEGCGIYWKPEGRIGRRI